MRSREGRRRSSSENKRDTLVRILGRAHNQAKLAIAYAIRDETNERIAGLMPNNSVRVERIENALHLRDQAGGSAGENLSVGYAFLATLFNRGNHHQLPFVVDSPVVPIDGDIRPTIGSLVPLLAGAGRRLHDLDRTRWLSPEHRARQQRRYTVHYAFQERCEPPGGPSFGNVVRCREDAGRMPRYRGRRSSTTSKSRASQADGFLHSQGGARLVPGRQG